VINIQELIAKSKASENNELVKGIWFLIQWSPDDYSQERFNIGVAFSSEKGERRVKCVNSFRKLSNWFGADLRKQGELVVKLATNVFHNRINNGVFFENGIHYIPMGMAQGQSIEKVINLLFEDVVTISNDDLSIVRSAYTSTKSIISTVREAISKNEELKEIMPENPMIETVSGVSVKVPIQFKNNAGTIVSADFSTSNSVENELLRSFRDVDLILKGDEFNKINSFLLLPSSDKGNTGKIRDLIGDYVLSLRSKGVETISAHQPSSLVSKIDGWYKEVA